MSHIHRQGRRRSVPFSPSLKTIDDEGEHPFSAHGRARSSSSGFEIFSERHLDLYLDGETFSPDSLNEIVALPPANQEIVRNDNFATLNQVSALRHLDWLVHGESLLPMLEQDGADCEPDAELAEQWEGSTSSFLQSREHQDEWSEEERPNILHARSCGDIPEESDAQEAVNNSKGPSGLFRARRAKSDAVFATQASNVKFESQQKKEGRSRWRRVKAFFLRK